MYPIILVALLSTFVLAGCWSSDSGGIMQWPNGPIQTVSVNTTLEAISEPVKKEPIFQNCLAQTIRACNTQVIYTYSQWESIEPCNNFTDSALKDTCIRAVTLEIARKKLDPKLCESLWEAERLGCERDIITARALESRDTRICREIPDEISGAGFLPAMQSARDACMFQVIQRLPSASVSPDLCKDLSSPQMQDVCLKRVKDRQIIEGTLPIKSPDPKK